MFNMVINIIKLTNSYNTNSFIYNLRKLPIIGKKIPKNLYHSYLLDALINLIVFAYNIVSPFIGKFIYLSLFIVLPMSFLNNTNAFINIFVFLTIIGGAINTFIFNPNKSKYYSIVLMRCDPKKYTISNFIYFCLKTLISYYPSLILIGISYNVNIIILCLLPIFVVCTKCIGNCILLKYYEKTKKILNENNFLLVSIISLIGLSLAYGLPYFGYSINFMIFIIIFAVFLIFGIISLRYILKCNNYSKIYKKMLNASNIVFDTNDVNKRNTKKTYSSKIENIVVSSNKKGFSYFNEIFIKRHQSILMKSAVKFAFIIGIIIIGIGLISFFDQNTSININKWLLNGLPYFIFIMYFINRGNVVTQAMFINCDNSMLAYRFYREPKTLLKLFSERLKSLIKINLIPTLVLALGLPILLFITGGTSNIFNYIFIFASIIFLSIFFSLHHLVLYYLLQPYDINMTSRSSTYSIINGITYFVCYMCIDWKLPILDFSLLIITFTVIYILIALFLIYKYAPITFKLK